MPSTSNSIKIIAFISVAIILFCTGLMIKLTIPYFSFHYDINFLLTKQSILHKDIWRWSFYIHIASSIFVLFFGVFQFIKPILIRFPDLHRFLGKLYVFLILTLSAPSGLIMGFYANGGFLAKISFVITSILWWIFTLVAFLKIKNRKLQCHISFMVRSYALTLSAITLRIYVLFIPSFIHLPAKDKYTLIAWASWIPNLIMAEILIKLKVFK